MLIIVKALLTRVWSSTLQTLSPTYRLLVGVPGRSNAFAIAERLGLQRSIIDHARGEVSEEDHASRESMIASLEENRIGAEAERQTAEALRRDMEAQRHVMRQSVQRSRNSGISCWLKRRRKRAKR